MADTKKVWRVEAQPSATDYLREAWHFRAIALHLAWRDILVRFKQTVIGVMWVAARPALVAVALAFVFGRIAGLQSDGVPYLIFVLVALLPWQFFAAAVSQGAESIVANAGMVTKIYFPRVLLPTSVILGNLFDFAVMLPIFLAACIWYGFVPSPSALIEAPIYIALLTILAFGISTLLATINSLYRDVRHLVPFLVQFGLFLSPIGYGIASVPEPYRPLYCLNPLAGLFESLRIAVIGTPDLLPSWALGWSVVASLLAAIVGLYVLLTCERRVVDVI